MAGLLFRPGRRIARHGRRLARRAGRSTPSASPAWSPSRRADRRRAVVLRRLGGRHQPLAHQRGAHRRVRGDDGERALRLVQHVPDVGQVEDAALAQLGGEVVLGEAADQQLAPPQLPVRDQHAHLVVDQLADPALPPDEGHHRVRGQQGGQGDGAGEVGLRAGERGAADDGADRDGGGEVDRRPLGERPPVSQPQAQQGGRVDQRGLGRDGRERPDRSGEPSRHGRSCRRGRQAGPAPRELPQCHLQGPPAAARDHSDGPDGRLCANIWLSPRNGRGAGSLCSCPSSPRWPGPRSTASPASCSSARRTACRGRRRTRSASPGAGPPAAVAVLDHRQRRRLRPPGPRARHRPDRPRAAAAGDRRAVRGASPGSARAPSGRLAAHGDPSC